MCSRFRLRVIIFIEKKEKKKKKKRSARNKIKTIFEIVIIQICSHSGLAHITTINLTETDMIPHK